LRTVSKGKDVIFFGINYPYHQWELYMKPLTAAVIEAAENTNATLLFPGNIYAFGSIPEPIREETPCEPTTKKGRIRFEMEEMLQEASSKGECRVINLRMPDFWGPNVTNGLIKPLFGNAAEGKTMQWLVRSDVSHQFVFTPDAAKLFHRLSMETSLPSYFVLNYGGEVVPSITWLAERISFFAKTPAKLRVYSKGMLKLLGIFMPQVRELVENFYQFEHCIILDDSKLRSMYPDWEDTNLDQGIDETIKWFRNN
ncbi:MAG: NAD-dependent epimerase/dehydratase family protein, partial [Bacteroidales bacterium]|nr:NAD-dependent epimerase/dehydratase family protein [Bacteroidales bacterium]